MTKPARKKVEPEDEDEDEERQANEVVVCVETPKLRFCKRIAKDEDDPEDDDE